MLNTAKGYYQQYRRELSALGDKRDAAAVAVWQELRDLTPYKAMPYRLSDGVSLVIRPGEVFTTVRRLSESLNLSSKVVNNRFDAFVIAGLITKVKVVRYGKHTAGTLWRLNLPAGNRAGNRADTVKAVPDAALTDGPETRRETEREKIKSKELKTNIPNTSSDDGVGVQVSEEVEEEKATVVAPPPAEEPTKVVTLLPAPKPCPEKARVVSAFEALLHSLTWAYKKKFMDPAAPITTEQADAMLGDLNKIVASGGSLNVPGGLRDPRLVFTAQSPYLRNRRPDAKPLYSLQAMQSADRHAKGVMLDMIKCGEDPMAHPDVGGWGITRGQLEAWLEVSPGLSIQSPQVRPEPTVEAACGAAEPGWDNCHF